MSHEMLSLEELARQLGRDAREIEKLASRGRIPGRKVAGSWQFHPSEITHWLETEMRAYTEPELARVEETQRSNELSQEVPVGSLIQPETVQVPLEARTKRSVLESLIEVAGRTWQVWEPATVLAAVQEREKVLATAYENGVAIPHPRNPPVGAVGQPIIAYGRTFSGIPFGAPRRGLTDIFFLVLCLDSRTHLQVLARLGRMMQQPGFVDQLRQLDTAPETYEFICQTDTQLGAN